MIGPRAGNLGPDVAPWLAWGPYLWANGMESRADGLVWRGENFQDDGIHPTPSGHGKVATMLLRHLKSRPESRSWFVAGQAC